MDKLESCRVKSFTLQSLRQPNHYTPCAIPFAYRDKLQAELYLLESQSIITPVTEATTWCAPIVVTPKKNSEKIRMCVDLSHLNCFIIRERHQSPTPAEAVADIAASKAKVFMVLDALKGYHQCPLDQVSRSITYHLHHAIWAVQIPPCPLWHFIHF